MILNRLRVLSLTLIYLALQCCSVICADQELPITTIFREGVKATVLVASIAKKKKNNETGSGFIISNDGLIVTNYHVIDKAKNILVKLNNGKTYEAYEILGVDKKRDIALIKIKETNLPFLRISYAKPQIGERVLAIGNPLGLENTLSDGLVSGIRERDKNFNIIQVSVPLSPGSSGGPLLNLEGEVIGITSASLASGQILNFAIPINYIQPLLTLNKIKESKLAKIPKRLSKKYETYVVKKNDTLFSIAKNNEISLTRLMKINNLSIQTISIGQKLMIPKQTGENP